MSKRLIPYVRQSRKKEQTISLSAQRDAITAWAKANDVELALVIEEQGVSGSKPWRERELGEAVAACERGEAGGIIVAFQDRLSRENGIGTAEVYEALERAGARLVAACEGLDTATGDHELLFTIKAAIAREQWKRFRKNWADANDECAAVGIYQGALPVGFDKGRAKLLPGTEGADIKDVATKQLTKNADAVVIKKVFEIKASGGSYKECGRVLMAAGVKTATGLTTWGATSIRSMLRNPIYKGLITNGHEHVFAEYAVVSPSTWADAQASIAPVPDTKAANGGRQHAGDWALLGGLVKCAACGKRMAPNSTTSTNGTVHREYACKRTDCDAKARAKVAELEAYVIEEAYAYFAQAVEANGGAGHGKDTDSDKLTGLEIEAEEARKRLTEFVALVDPTDPGAKERMDSLRATMQAAEAAVADEREATRVIVTPEEMREAFEEADLAGRRALVRMMLDGVIVTGRKKDGTVQERTEIEYRTLVFGGAA
jgi:DNA invertase Pin-like site-specific DNA recombinase